MKFYLKFIKDIFFTLAFTVLYSILNIAILMYINEQILTLALPNIKTILVFGFLLILFLIFAVLSRAVISILGHNFVYNIRLKMVRDILNAKFESLNKIGKSKLLASLSSDINSLSMGFGAIPEALQGIFVLIFTLGYIGYLSLVAGGFVMVWLVVMVLINFYFMKKAYYFFNKHRAGEDILYKDYSECIEGFKEFSINSSMADYFLNTKFIPNAKNMKFNIVNANIYIAFVSNFLSAMILGAIGIIFYATLAHGLIDFKTATTIAIAILFVRSPLIMALSALPSIQKAKIALKKLNSLKLDQNQICSEYFNFSNWQKIEFKNVNFSYENGFGLKNINMQINRGKTIFITGVNGGGKSTLFLLILGLLTPKSGEILVDNIKIDSSNLSCYKNIFSVVFSDFYLFDEFLSNDIDKIKSLLKIFDLDEKIKIDNKKIYTKELSMGQRKRLALISALLCDRKLLLLDEWAADQDPKFRAIFYDEILAYLNGLGISVVLISHDDKYFNRADEIYKMENGKIELISAC